MNLLGRLRPWRHLILDVVANDLVALVTWLAPTMGVPPTPNGTERGLSNYESDVLEFGIKNGSSTNWHLSSILLHDCWREGGSTPAYE